MHTLKRILTILKVQVSQLDILETMTPLEFLSFRERLDAASGFQSDQFRQMEFVLGMKRADVHGRFPEGGRARAALEGRYRERGLWDAFLGYLDRAGFSIPGKVLQRDFRDPLEGIQEWRYRHVKMVQRTIGSKQRTGGSAGSGYLVTTLMTPCFPDLWEIRSQL